MEQNHPGALAGIAPSRSKVISGSGFCQPPPRSSPKGWTTVWEQQSSQGHGTPGLLIFSPPVSHPQLLPWFPMNVGPQTPCFPETGCLKPLCLPYVCPGCGAPHGAVQRALGRESEGLVRSSAPHPPPFSGLHTLHIYK